MTPDPPQVDVDLPEVYVVGHRNPDTDSVASAIGYAELKAALDPSTRYIPARLGDLNPQTTWAVERAGAQLPEYLPHIRLRVVDVMRERFPVVHEDEPVRVAGSLMVKERMDLLPVVDDDGALAGVLTERALARRYVRESHKVSRLGAPTAPSAMAGVLDGELLCGPDDRVSGRVWVLAMDVASLLSDVADGDVAVVGDRPDAQLAAVERGISVLVISNGAAPASGLLAAAEQRGTPVITTPLDSYVAGRMITLSSPCAALIDSDPLTVRRDHLVADVSDDVKEASYRAAIVVDRARKPIGLVTRADLVDPQPRRVVLVDHAEQAQSVHGVEHAEIVEILDHHHIGSIETKLPVFATFDPVGSTSTLVAERFRSHGIKPSRPAATMLLAAVLSDTVILNSPTTTDRDRVAMDWLAERLGLDPLEFGRKMFQETSDVSHLAPADIVARDAKSYELAGGQTMSIAQVETVGDGLLDRLTELREAVSDYAEREGHRIMALMVTDVLEHGTQLVVGGDVALAERALGKQAVDGVIDLPGVMSRKKQVAPKLLSAS